MCICVISEIAPRCSDMNVLKFILCLLLCTNEGATEFILNNFSKASALSDKVLTEEPLFALYAQTKFDCLSTCGQEQRCLLVSYNAGERWCRLYEDGTGVSTEDPGWRSWRATACSAPPLMSNGITSYKSRRVGSLSAYSCFVGYNFMGTRQESLCTEDGTWVGPDGTCDPDTVITDCRDIQTSNPTAASGVYTILPTVGSGPISVYCDMTDNGGGWTVIQRRTDGSENFYRDWDDYKNGFGTLDNEFWLGNTNIWRLTNQRNYELWIELEDWIGVRRFATYSWFVVSDESHDFSLDVEGYIGNLEDSFSYHDDMKFSTYDKDNDDSDGHCAVGFVGAWWYGDCSWCNLNGLYNSTEYGKGVFWNTFRGPSYSMKYASMKIRPN